MQPRPRACYLLLLHGLFIYALVWIGQNKGEKLGSGPGEEAKNRIPSRFPSEICKTAPNLSRILRTI